MPVEPRELIGWLSAATLLFTMALQVHRQWRTQSVEGVSYWLFVGQLAASAGFTVYSVLLHNWVFTATNLMLFGNAVLGQVVYLRNRRRAEAG